MLVTFMTGYKIIEKPKPFYDEMKVTDKWTFSDYLCSPSTGEFVVHSACSMHLQLPQERVKHANW